MKKAIVGRFTSKNVQDIILSTIENIGKFNETHVIMFDTQNFDIPLKIINKGTQQVTIVEGDKNYHRWQAKSLDKWKLNNNAIDDINYLNTDKNSPSILLASKCVLNANVEEIFNTTEVGKKNSETFIRQVLQFNSNDYKKKYPNKSFKLNYNKQVPYSKNTVFVIATNKILSQKHCINYLKKEASTFYSQENSSLLSAKTKVSFITFINPELYCELFTAKNNFSITSKTIIKESIFFNTLFNIKEIGSFKCDEFSPNMILPNYTKTKISKLENNNIDPNLIKGILIQPKSINELNFNSSHINKMFIKKLKFLLSIFNNIKKSETVEDVFKKIFKTYPKSNYLSTKFWSIPINEWLTILPELFDKPLTTEMEKELKNFSISKKK
uniref:TGT domain-containing protein n=1 Tax=Strongyloides stercoralis TaxID=6248 RepID=A0A0K0EBG1_STRER